MDEFEKAGMLKRYQEGGKTYGYWVGIEKPGRLPPPFQRSKYQNLPPLPPEDSSWKIEYVNSKTGETCEPRPPFPEVVRKTDEIVDPEGIIGWWSTPIQKYDGWNGNPIIEVPIIKSTLPLDSQIESKCQDVIGLCEPRKTWAKELKEAVRVHGHDEVLAAFENWIESQVGFTGKKPVTTFLRSLAGGITARPAVQSPALQKVELEIAAVSDSQVLFSNLYRPLLASLINQYGEVDVGVAFKDFWATADEKSLPWAAKNFIEQAGVRIEAARAKKIKADQRKTAAQSALAAAQANVDQVEEEYVEEEL